MDLKAALATGKRVALAGVTDGFISKAEIDDMLAGGDLTTANIFSDAWTIEPVSTVRFTEADFKTMWDEVAGEFTSVKTFENSALAKKLIARFVSSYKVG